MKLISCFLAGSLFVSTAWAQTELQALIRCHEAVSQISEGGIKRLRWDHPTPFALRVGPPAHSNILFVTSESVYKLDTSALHGKTIYLRLQEKVAEDSAAPFIQKVDITKDGGSDFEHLEVLPSAPEKPLEPTPAKDAKVLGLFKQDLLQRLQSPGRNGFGMGYQDTEMKEKRIEALRLCEEMPDPDFQNKVRALQKKYDSPRKKPAPSAPGVS